MDFETFLLDNGYDTTLEGGVVFCFLLEEALFLCEKGNSKKQMEKELHSLYICYIYRFFRTDRSKFFTSITEFLKSKKDKNKGTVERVDDALIRLAKKYRIENGLVDKNKGKMKVKIK